MANFPTTVATFSNPTGSDYLNSPPHATQHANENDEIIAVQTKVGTGSSTPIANTLLRGTGTGSTEWSAITPQSAWITDSDAATITFDLSTGPKHRVTLGGNRVLALSTVLAGHVFVIALSQDGTGSRTVTWFSTVTWPGGTTPTLTTTGLKTDVFGFIQTGTDAYYGFIIGQNL